MMRFRTQMLVTLLVMIASCALLGMARDARAEPQPHVNLSQPLSDLTVEEAGDDYYVILYDNGERYRLSANEFMSRLNADQQLQAEHGWLFLVLNITTWYGVLWVGLGLGGQVLFTGRMIVQWLASERLHKSVVPPVFWWMSLIGATMLLIYFVWRKDIVGVIGQSTGWAVYARNLWLIHGSLLPWATTKSQPST